MSTDQRILMRDHALETLCRGFNDFQACLLSLEGSDDAGAIHHFSRLVTIVRSAAVTLSEMRALNEAERGGVA